MRIRSLNNELDPHEFNGLVYNLAAEQIPIHLAKTARESGHVLVWADQAFCNHDHQLIDDDDARTEEPLMVAEIADVLRTRFPHKRFVIELDPV